MVGLSAKPNIGLFPVPLVTRQPNYRTTVPEVARSIVKVQHLFVGRIGSFGVGHFEVVLLDGVSVDGTGGCIWVSGHLKGDSAHFLVVDIGRI